MIFGAPGEPKTGPFGATTPPVSVVFLGFFPGRFREAPGAPKRRAVDKYESARRNDQGRLGEGGSLKLDPVLSKILESLFESLPRLTSLSARGPDLIENAPRDRPPRWFRAFEAAVFSLDLGSSGRAKKRPSNAPGLLFGTFSLPF